MDHIFLKVSISAITSYFKTINREYVTRKVKDTNSISLDQRRHLMSTRNASKLFFAFYWIKCVAITVSILQPANSYFNILLVQIHFNHYTIPCITDFWHFKAFKSNADICTSWRGHIVTKLPVTSCQRMMWCHMRVTLLVVTRYVTYVLWHLFGIL